MQCRLPLQKALQSREEARPQKIKCPETLKPKNFSRRACDA
jgi:hypothetical protein